MARGASRTTRRAIWAGMIFLCLANLFSWDSGYGYRIDHADLELRFGWPATYRADWWIVAGRSLQPAYVAGTLWSGSENGLELRSRFVGLPPALADLLFAAAFLVAIATCAESIAQENWTRGRIVAATTAGAIMLGIWMIAEQIGVSL